MKKSFTAASFIFLFFTTVFAQENNPYINSEEVINEAVKLHDEGKYRAALALYKKVNRSDTNYVRALYESALSYSADSQYDAAINACKLAMAEKTDAERMPDILTQYGSLLDNIGEPDKSIHIFDSAIQLYPEYSMLYLNKATTLLRAKKFREAEQVLQQAVLQDPYTASCHFKLGIAALETGKLVPAMLSFMSYLLVSPDGRYSSNCISLLNSIAKNNDEIRVYIDNRTEPPAEEYKLAEQIIQSKIALDKNYKSLIALDDPISRQIQVLLEKLPYSAGSKDFWMQYYVPFYKNIFAGRKFEDLINYLFAGVNIPQIQQYNKKNKKEIQALVEETIVYFNKIRATRQLNYSLRDKAEDNYYYENGKFSGKGRRNTKGDKFTGNWTFYYSPGNIRSSGHFNDNGEKEGSWIYYYMDGTIKARQTFANGRQDGNEKFYFQNGLISSDAFYKEDNLEAAGNSYYYAGARNIIAHYIKGKLNGERKQFFSNGNLKSIENFTDNKLNGNFIIYHKNGITESQGVYVNGELEGPYKVWDNNGHLGTEGQYTKDKATGTWKKYHDNGRLKSIENFIDGKEEGEYVEYFSNGQLFTRYNYKKGAITGEVIYHDDDGKPYAVFQFDGNRLISARYMDKAGKEPGASVLKDKKLDLLSFYTDGTKKAQLLYNSKGNAEGTETNFYHCGKISQTNEYTNGQLNGKTVNYYLNGKKSAELSYADGVKDGYYKSYHINGLPETEGWYKDNMAEGPWINYDELGNLVAVTYFYNDESDGHKEEFYVNGKKEYDTRYHRGWLEEMIQYDTAGKEINRVKIEQGSGRFSSVHLDGKIKFEGNYVRGDFEGPCKFYFFDGADHVSQFYKKGEPDSIYRSYYYGGQLNIEGQYKLGKKAGTWNYYRKNGTLGSKEEYADGELNGHNIAYHDNGKIDLDIHYVNGERNGDTKKYEPGGNLVYQITCKKDLPVSYTYSDTEGKLVTAIPFTGGSGKLSTWYSNGQLATEHVYIEGKTDGPYKLYYPNGKLWTEREDNYDICNGPLKKYYENGQLKASYTYITDNLHGPYKEYNDKGIVTEEGNYYNGSNHGDMKLYNESGRLIETHIYYYGRLLTVKK